MRRRAFITFVASAAITLPHASIAHAADQLRRIALLYPFAEDDQGWNAADAAFKKELARLGWAVGRNVQIDERRAVSDPGRLRAVATELVELAPDVIYTVSGTALEPLREATRTIPIVFIYVVDPVGRGFVSSLAHPGGNITGFTPYDFSVAGKWVEIIKEVAPRVTRVALIYNPDVAPYTMLFLPAMTAAAKSLALEFVQDPVLDEGQIERAVSEFAREPGGGLIVGADIFTYWHRERIAKLASDVRLPAVYPWKEGAASGGLLSYGSDIVDLARSAASYVDRILRGESPGALPVQQPIKFELVVNLRAANALGLTIPPSLFARADEVIE